MVGAILVLPVVSLQAESGPELAAFDKEIKPLLNKYCISCHGPEESEASLRLDELDPDLVSGGDGDLWEEVYNQLNIGDMPPEDEQQPTVAEREKISAWVHKQLHHAAQVKRSTGGRNVLRRMTAYEYSNTLRDLLGVNLNFAKSLPPEAAAEEGFVNNYEVLGMSSLHVEYFFDIAKKALDKALFFGEKPQVLKYEFNALETQAEKVAAYEAFVEKVQAFEEERRNTILSKISTGAVYNGEATKDGVLLSANGGVFRQELPPIKIDKVSHTLSKDYGRIRVTVRAAAKDPSRITPPYMEVNYGIIKEKRISTIGSDPIGSAVVESEDFQDYVFDFRSEDFANLPKNSQYIIEVFNAMGSEVSSISGSGILIDSVSLEAPYFGQWPPKTRTRITDVTKHNEGSDEAVRDILTTFMTRAYRRPVMTEDVDLMVKLYQSLREIGVNYEEALTNTLATVLSSPGFLYLTEPAPAGSEPGNPRKLDGYEIASRLSYFLWSTMPDGELLSLAENEKLQDKSVLAAQVDRMLKDPRSKTFTSNFTRQWLALDQIYSVAVNPEYFPDFDDAMKDVMIVESIKTFDHLLSENKSVLELIDSKQVVINSKLAEYYGIPGVDGEYFRPVTLDASSQRGGLLSQASILTINSSGDDTDPIKRGVWVLERLLGDPPPPPPPGVPTLPEDEERGGELSLRQKLEAHRKHESCNTCHAKIDPWGVAFENFDGIGVWRDTNKTQSLPPGQKRPNSKGKKTKKNKAELRKLYAYVDPSTQLADGTAIADLEALKAYILKEKRDQFAETFVRKMMGYALGRHLDFTDRESVEALSTTFAADGYRPRNLIKNIVLSDSFLTK